MTKKKKNDRRQRSGSRVVKKINDVNRENSNRS